MEGFLVAGGSVPGTDHTQPGQPRWTNNHDAWAFRSDSNYLTAVVCDGCGSTSYPEVGARIGCEAASKSLSRLLSTGVPLAAENAQAVLGCVEADVLNAICGTARSMDLGDGTSVLASGFLFTIVGVAMGKDHTIVFSFGDGVISLNGETTVLGPFENNAPPYIAYKAVRSEIPKSLLCFKVHAIVPTRDVNSVLIGSDGCADIMAASDQPLPGLSEPLGPLSQFWENDMFVRNPDMIRRRLAMANKDRIEYSTDAEGRLVGAPLIKKGLLRDDTTLVVVRRQEGA